MKSLILAPNQSVDTKAIPAYRPLLQGSTDPILITGPNKTRTPFGQREAGRHLQAYGGANDAIDWVMACVKLIVETASTADWHFEEYGKKLVRQKTPESPPETEEAPFMLTRLFNEPNPYMDWEELVELTLIDYLLVGNSYWLKWRTNDLGQPLALYRLAPPFVQVVPGPMGIEGYEYKVPGVGEIKLAPDQVVHFKQANPHSPYYGLGIVQGIARMLDLELALTDTVANYYEKRAQPSMVVQSDRRVPDAVFQRLKTQLRQMYGGPKNAGSLMVLEAGLKYQSISPSAQEAAFDVLSAASRDRILAMFRVPGVLLGIGDTAGGKYSDAERIFTTKTVQPLLHKFQKAVTRQLTQPGWDLDFVVDYEYIMPEEERARLTTNFASIPGVKVREVREYAGLEPLGDERDDWVLNLPGEDGTEDDHDGGNPDRPLGSEAGRPPNPENTSRFPEVGGGRPALGKNVEVAPKPRIRSVSKKAYDQRPESKSLSEIRARFAILEETAPTTISPSRVEEIESKFDQIEEKLAQKALSAKAAGVTDTLREDREAAVDALVIEIKKEILDAAHVLERELLDELERGEKAIGDRLRSRLRRSEAWKKFSGAVSEALERAARYALSTSVMQQGRAGNIAEEEIDYDALAREIVYRREGIQKITKTLRDDVAKKVGAALEAGADREQLIEAIRQPFEIMRDSKAETIAMTEATHAYNEGTLTVAEALGRTEVMVFDGDEYDEPCQEANGQIWSIEKARENRLQHPRCRRAFVPLTNTEVS